MYVSTRCNSKLLLPLFPSFFLFHFAGWSGIVLCCPMRKEVGVRKCLFFWDQQELASSQAVPFFAPGTMHWRHTPQLDLGISHGKMFPEFRSQAQGKADDGVRVRVREVEGEGEQQLREVSGDTNWPISTCPDRSEEPFPKTWQASKSSLDQNYFQKIKQSLREIASILESNSIFSSSAEMLQKTFLLQ